MQTPTRRLGNASAQLDQVVVTGTSAGGRRDAPAAAPAPAEMKREGQFEMAKAAAAQRAVTTLSAVDSVSADFGGATTRRVGTRTFSLTGTTWTDSRYTQGMRTVRVKPYSAAYFALLERLDDLRAPFALMGKDGTPGVVVAGRKVAIAIDAAGAETLDARDIAAIESGW
jgi:hypothetical protein